MDRVTALDRFQKSNTGFALIFQFINVENFDGTGESTPTPHFYQNISEAEYDIVFEYMVLIGYPAQSIYCEKDSYIAL